MLPSRSLRRFRPLLSITRPLPPPSLRSFSKSPSPEDEEDKKPNARFELPNLTQEERADIDFKKNKEGIVDFQPVQPRDWRTFRAFRLTNKSDDLIVKFEFSASQCWGHHNYRMKPQRGVLQPRQTVEVKVKRELIPFEDEPLIHFEVVEVGPNSITMKSEQLKFTLFIFKGREILQTIDVPVFKHEPIWETLVADPGEDSDLSEDSED